MSRVFRNIATPLKLFGLELTDLTILLVMFLLLFNISDHIVINFMFLIGSYVAMRVLKKGKPPGYILDLIKFLLSPSQKHIRLENGLPAYKIYESNSNQRLDSN